MIDKIKIIKDLVKKNSGLTITEIVDKSKYSRSTVRTILARLEGSGEVVFRNVGMAKVYVSG